jgi:AraC-like DNA-binding protein
MVLSPSQQPYCYDLKAEKVNGEGSHWIFPHTQTYQLDHSKPFLHLGIKFHIGALYSLDLLPSQPNLNTVCDIDVNVSLGVEPLIDNSIFTLAQKYPEQCCERLDEICISWFKNNHEDRHSKLTREALALLLNNKSISELSSLLSYSQRTLERSFKHVTGMTLKQCQSMNRLESMLEYLYQRDVKAIDWAQIAYQFGFSDQPHLIRHLKSSIGATPQRYGNQRDLTIDVYGGVEASED